MPKTHVGFRDQTEVLIVRCFKDKTLRSKGDFQYPSTIGSVVKPTSWNRKKECGGGLHGWLFGVGSRNSAPYGCENPGRWMLLKAKKNHVIDLGGKVKCKEAVIVDIGSYNEIKIATLQKMILSGVNQKTIYQTARDYVKQRDI
jgi:hypothetical protein